MAVGKIYCPKCKILLSTVSYNGVTIDKCPHCSGVWLDNGEEKFVVEILRRLDNKSCESCNHFIDKKKCRLLKIVVNRDFHCSHHSPA